MFINIKLFENNILDMCRKCVLQNNGLKIIIDVVSQTVSLDGDMGADLRSCSVGLLLNFVAGFEDLNAKVKAIKKKNYFPFFYFINLFFFII